MCSRRVQCGRTVWLYRASCASRLLWARLSALAHRLVYGAISKPLRVAAPLLRVAAQVEIESKLWKRFSKL